MDDVRVIAVPAHAPGPTGSSGATGPTGATGTTGSGNTVAIATQTGTPTTTSSTYTTSVGSGNAPPSIVVTGAHTVLVTIYLDCHTAGNDDGCWMALTASGGATIAASNAKSVGSDRAGKVFTTAGGFAASASFLVTTTADTTFSAAYKANAGTITADASHIIVQVY